MQVNSDSATSFARRGRGRRFVGSGESEHHQQLTLAAAANR